MRRTEDLLTRILETLPSAPDRMELSSWSQFIFRWTTEEQLLALINI